MLSAWRMDLRGTLLEATTEGQVRKFFTTVQMAACARTLVVSGKGEKVPEILQGRIDRT